jgi:hypothetical protein
MSRSMALFSRFRNPHGFRYGDEEVRGSDEILADSVTGRAVRIARAELKTSGLEGLLPKGRKLSLFGF